MWIKSHGEAIFNTTYWTITPEEGVAVRFTQTRDAFYITTLYAPNDTLILDSPVPYVPGDQVTVVGGNLSGTVVPSELLANGSLRLSVSDEVKAADEYAWVFKISYDAAAAAAAGNASGPGTNTSGGGIPPGPPITSEGVLRYDHEAWSLLAALLVPLALLSLSG